MTPDPLRAALGIRLQEKIASIRRNPASARVIFRAQTRLEQGVQCSAVVRKFAPMQIDEPPDLGGADTAMGPVELLLVALGTCQEIVYALYAAVMDIPLHCVSVNVKGYLDVRGLLALDDAVPAGCQKITFETRIESPADPKAVQQLVQMTEACCPVLDTLKRPIEVSGSFFLNGQRLDTPESIAA